MPVADWLNLASAQCLQTRFYSADGALLLTKLTAAPCPGRYELAQDGTSSPRTVRARAGPRWIGAVDRRAAVDDARY